MRLLWLSIAAVLGASAAHAETKVSGDVMAAAAASDAPVIAVLVEKLGAYHVWISRDDGVTFTERIDPLQWKYGSTLRVDRDGHVDVDPPVARPSDVRCAADVGDTTYRVRKGRLQVSDGHKTRTVTVPGIDLADRSLGCVIVGNEHAVYALFATNTHRDLVRLDGARPRRVNSGFHLVAAAVDSHGGLLATHNEDALMRGDVALARRDTPPGCFVYSDEVAPRLQSRGSGMLVDGANLRQGIYCDTPDRIVVITTDKVYSLSRRAGAVVLGGPITSKQCHDGCRFESAATVVETNHATGPLDVELVEGPLRVSCQPDGATDAMMLCSTRTHLAFVQEAECEAAKEPAFASRLELVLVDRSSDFSEKTVPGVLASTNADGTLWTYHFEPDINLVVTTGPRPAMSLQIAGTREDCLGFFF
jgi:hypothetical protein